MNGWSWRRSRRERVLEGLIRIVLVLVASMLVSVPTWVIYLGITHQFANVQDTVYLVVTLWVVLCAAVWTAFFAP